MGEVFQWVVENWPMLMAALWALVNLAVAITDLTPTDADNKVVATIKGVLDRLSVLTGKNAAGTVKLPLTASKPLSK